MKREEELRCANCKNCLVDEDEPNFKICHVDGSIIDDAEEEYCETNFEEKD